MSPKFSASMEILNRVAALSGYYNSPIVVHSVDEGKKLKNFELKSNAWTTQQVEAYESTLKNLITFFGGAKGGAKSVGGVRIAQRYIATSRGGIVLVLRKNYTDMLNTTKQSYERFFPENLILTKTLHEWTCVNDWRIWFRHADASNDPEFEKLRGLEVSFVHADEVSQLNEKFYEVIPSCLRLSAYYLDTSLPIHPFVYMTSNPVPGGHWTKKFFIDARTKRGENYKNRAGESAGHKFIQSLPDDNPLLPDSYLSTAFSTMGDVMLRMLRYGEWDIDESDLKIIPSFLWKGVQGKVVDRTPKWAGMDVGMGGEGDKSKIWCCNEHGQLWSIELKQMRDMIEMAKQVAPIVKLIQTYRGKFLIDSASMGVGTLLRKEFFDTIVEVNFGGKADDPIHYKNTRAELYGTLREACQNHNVLIETNDETDEEVENTYFILQDGALQIESKKDIRERLGRSPDSLDGLVLCAYAYRRYKSMGYDAEQINYRTAAQDMGSFGTLKLNRVG
jgi:hypothetical protein